MRKLFTILFLMITLVAQAQRQQISYQRLGQRFLCGETLFILPHLRCQREDSEDDECLRCRRDRRCHQQYYHQP